MTTSSERRTIDALLHRAGLKPDAKRRKPHLRHVRVWASVSHADVLYGHDTRTLRELSDGLAPITAYVPDLISTWQKELVFALCSPSLPEGRHEEDWYSVFLEHGVNQKWLSTIERLRVRTHPEFSEVFDVEGAANAMGTFWEGDRAEGYQLGDPRLGSECGRVPAYTLPLTARVPASGELGKPRPKAPDSRRAPVWPYPCRPEDVEVVASLAGHLAPRIERTFNGRNRLLQYPVLAPLCALAATVDASMALQACRTRHDPPRPRAVAFHAILDALELGGHRNTAERVLLRDHARHIHVDAGGTPETFTQPRWRHGLGLFASDNGGNLREVNDLNRGRFEPRILHCLAAAEPL